MNRKPDRRALGDGGGRMQPEPDLTVQRFAHIDQRHHLALHGALAIAAGFTEMDVLGPHTPG